MKSDFKAMITGSFDPVTEGHMDIIDRAASLFPQVYVVMFINPQKQYMFSKEERLEFLKQSCMGYKNVKVDFSCGMVVDYAKEKGISVIIRGIRGDEDIAYEKQMAEYNFCNGGVETLLLPAKPKYEGFSSTLARDTILKNGDLTGLLPECVTKAISSKNND